MGRDEPIENALKLSAASRDAYEREPEAREIVDAARALEGLRREDSVHAAGVVIGDARFVNYLPLKLSKDSRDDSRRIVTQFDMHGVEDLGLLKMDFLGLRTLSVIEDTLSHLRRREIDLDIDHVPLDDEAVYTMLHDQHTVNCTGDDGRPMFTNVGRFLLAVPERVGDPAPEATDGRTARPRWPVRFRSPPGSDCPRCTTSSGRRRSSSITPPTWGNQSETGVPDWPYGLNVRRQGMTGRFISATLSPKPIASISLPACLLSLGSKVSMWLTPPHMNRKMTDLALGSKCGPSRGILELPVFRPERAHGDAEKAAASLVEEPAPGDLGRRDTDVCSIHLLPASKRTRRD